MLLRLLQQRGRILQRVTGHNTIVMISRHEQSARPLSRRRELDVVQRGILVDELEVIRIVGITVLRHPGATDGELVEAQHVEDTDTVDDGSEEVRPLLRAGAHQKSTVRTSMDRQFGSAGVLLADQMLGS